MVEFNSLIEKFAARQFKGVNYTGCSRKIVINSTEVFNTIHHEHPWKPKLAKRRNKIGTNFVEGPVDRVKKDSSLKADKIELNGNK